MSSEEDRVVSNLRACIISSPDAIPATDLNRDYRSLVGETIPFKRLGFPSLEDFLIALPDFEVIKKSGEYYVRARSTSGSSHIADLVRGQKKASKKPRKTRPPFRSNRPPVSNTRYRPPVNQVPHFLQGPPKQLEIPKQKASFIVPNNSSFSQIKSIPPITQNVSSAAKNNSSHVFPKDQSVPLLPQPPPVASTWKPQIPAAMRPKPDKKSLIQNLKPSRKTVADRLMAHKAESMSDNKKASNVSLPDEQTYLEVCADQMQVKWVDPVSKNWKPKNSIQQSPSESGAPSSPSFKMVDVAPYQYDEVSFILKLNRYADEHNWPKPEFFVLNLRRSTKRAPGNFLCRVSVNCTPIGSKSIGHSISKVNQAEQDVDCYEFSSYPEEFQDVNLAMSYVAKKAYEGLLEKDTIKLPETVDNDVMVKRVSEMVKGKDQGIWLHEVEKMYKEQFNECLPSNFPQLTKISASIEVTKLAESYYVVRPKSTEVSAKFFSPNYVSRLVISKLTLPDDQTWDVFVSRIKSLNEIYIKIIGENYSDLYEALAIEMDNHYLGEKDPKDSITEIEIGKHYALVTNEDEPCVFRVLVTGFSSTNLYQVYLIDVGDVDVINAPCLRALLPKFFQLPAQAIPCFLEGLDEYDFVLSNTEIHNYLCEKILGRSFAGSVTNQEPVRIILYDTSSDADINMNDAIKNVVDNSFHSPNLNEEGVLKQIIVSTVDQNRQVHAQVPSWTLDCLNHKLALISNGYFEVTYLKCLKDVSYDQIYFWSNGLCRVKILKALDELEVDVHFIDIGGQSSVPIAELYEVDHLADLLPKIPPQAIPLLLHGVGDGKLKPYEVSKFLDMVNSNSDSPTIGKVITVSNGTPVVEIFVRSEASSLLVSVNQNLILAESYQLGGSQSSLGGISNAPSHCTVNNPASVIGVPEAVLPKGSILPKVGNEWAIYVTGIASPNNFTVTPVDYLQYLNQLTEEMFMFYSSSSTNTVYKPQNGECVAALFDGSWFRVQINNKIESDCYAGKYLDRGHMDTFSSKSIRALPEKFKKLPYLAFKAQLHGIKPVNKDWNVGDCLRIKELIQNKKFISIIRDILEEEDGKKLSLEIIDTSTAEDVYISRQFIIEKRALPTFRISDRAT